MKTKIVYVLVSNKNDYYVEMLLLSLYSLRLYHPNDKVEVVMDDMTYYRLVKQKSLLLSDVKPIVVDIPQEYTQMQRSRYLKTRLREVISGDFIYLDTDTVIADSLMEIDSFRWEMAAVLDNHDGKITKWQIQSEPKNWANLYPFSQYNCGILYVKDTPGSHRFFCIWHENWKYCISKGCCFDQPAHRKTVSDTGASIHELNGRWNCQVNTAESIKNQKDALIYHYKRAGFYVSRICREIRKKGKVTGIAAALAENPHQYLCGQTFYITKMEYSSLDSLRKTQYDYPGFFFFLVNMAGLYRALVTGLTIQKQKIAALIKR